MFDSCKGSPPGPPVDINGTLKSDKVSVVWSVSPWPTICWFLICWKLNTLVLLP